MVVIRLARGGSKKNPFYHVVVADKRRSRDGRFIERVGYFDPMARGKATRLTLENDRISHWVAQGAQPSLRVYKLIKDFENGNVQAAPSKAEQRKEQVAQSAKALAAKAKQEKEAAASEAAETESAQSEEEAK